MSKSLSAHLQDAVSTLAAYLQSPAAPYDHVLREDITRIENLDRDFHPTAPGALQNVQANMRKAARAELLWGLLAFFVSGFLLTALISTALHNAPSWHAYQLPVIFFVYGFGLFATTLAFYQLGVKRLVSSARALTRRLQPLDPELIAYHADNERIAHELVQTLQAHCTRYLAGEDRQVMKTVISQWFNIRQLLVRRQSASDEYQTLTNSEMIVQASSALVQALSNSIAIMDLQQTLKSAPDPQAMELLKTLRTANRKIRDNMISVYSALVKIDITERGWELAMHDNALEDVREQMEALSQANLEIDQIRQI